MNLIIVQSPDPSSEIAFIREQITSLTQEFDLAAEKDVKLGELKKKIHEIRLLSNRLEELNTSVQKYTE